MKRTVSVILAIISLICTAMVCRADYLGVPAISAEAAYVVMEATTGQVLIERDMNVKKYPASITKIMTALLTLENVSLDENVKISESVYSIPSNSSHIALIPGEKLTVEQLLYGMMLPSANDAAIGLAEYVGGDLDAFAAMMNERAKSIGAENTHFTNPHGLPDEDHYTTPYDMALITRAALATDGFETVFSTSSYTCPETNKQDQKRYFHTEVQMLNKGSEYYYEWATGGKFGWTEDSKYTCVVTAEKNGMKLICVLMKTNKRYDRMYEVADLFDYCFDNFETVSISDSGEDRVSAVYDAGGQIGNNYVSTTVGFSCLLHKKLTTDCFEISYDIPEDSYIEDEFSPSVTVTLNGGKYMCSGTVAQMSLDYSYKSTDRLSESDVTVIKLTEREKVTKPADEKLKIVIIIGAVILVLICIWLLIRRHNIRKYRTIRRRKKIEMYRRMSE